MMHGNALSGSIPLDLGNLHSLRWLTMHDNNFSGVALASACELPCGLAWRVLYLTDLKNPSAFIEWHAFAVHGASVCTL